MATTVAALIEDLRQVAAGDRAAFARVYGATSAKLYGIILRILGRRDLADEILQEVYVRIWERAGDFDASRASPITWMATIARNRALDEVRKATHVRLDDAPEAMQIADDAIGAEGILMARQDLQRLLGCLEGLSPERREMVRLAYLDGWSREALGQRFGHPVATVKTWLHRSLKQLKDCLGS
jgi:RNA polymerase sigma-70 factor (ECF subfamily)